MLSTITKELVQLSDDKRINKTIKDGCDIKCLGIKIGDLKKIIKKYKINNDNNLAIKLIETKIFDFMYLGFLIMDPKGIDIKYFKKWLNYSTYYKILIHSLAYGVSEHDEAKAFMQYLKEDESDINMAVYYGVLSGLVVINPDFEKEILIQEITYIKDNINTSKYASLNQAKYEMISFLSYVGMQVKSLDQMAMDCYLEIKDDLEISSSRRTQDPISFIQSCIDKEIQGKKRKSARC